MSFYNRKVVLVTGDQGFKGRHLVRALKKLGAIVYGFDLPNNDIRDPAEVAYAMLNFKPDVVFHLAAQAFVPVGFREPLRTFEVNAIGTVNVLEALRVYERPCTAVIVTTDDEISRAIDRAIFPGEQGGPHVNVFAALALTFKLAQTKQFKKLQEQTIKNAQAMADELPATKAAGEVKAVIASLRLAPQVEAQEGPAPAGAPRQTLVEGEVGLAHGGVVHAVAGRGLRADRLAVRRHEQRVRVLPADPLRGRVHVDLDDHLQPLLLGQREEDVDRVEAILSRRGLAAGPVDPAADGVESQLVNLLQIAPPCVAFRERIALQHRRARLAAPVPHGHGKEGFGLRGLGGSRRRGSQEQHQLDHR